MKKMLSGLALVSLIAATLAAGPALADTVVPSISPDGGAQCYIINGIQVCYVQK